MLAFRFLNSSSIMPSPGLDSNSRNMKNSVANFSNGYDPMRAGNNDSERYASQNGTPIGIMTMPCCRCHNAVTAVSFVTARLPTTIYPLI